MQNQTGERCRLEELARRRPRLCRGRTAAQPGPVRIYRYRQRMIAGNEPKLLSTRTFPGSQIASAKPFDVASREFMISKKEHL